MADVEMPDAGSSAAAKPKDPTTKSAKAGGADTSMEGKKRFEVKKVRDEDIDLESTYLRSIVECSSLVGMGYCCRQLCYLSKSYHGSLYVE